MNVFITGGLSGMGRELAQIYQTEGHTVGICSLESKEEAENISYPADFYYQVDVTNKQAIKNAIEDFANKTGSLDLVMANAGISMDKSDSPDFDRGDLVIKTNILGVSHTFAPAISIMKAQGSGHLAAMASLSAFSGVPGMAYYSASKAFVLTFCEALQIDLKKFGINVSVMAPGFVKTPLTEKNPHKTPFEMSAKEAALSINKALNKKKPIHTFPTQLVPMGWAMRHLPRPLYRAIMEKDPLKLKKS